MEEKRLLCYHGNSQFLQDTIKTTAAPPNFMKIYITPPYIVAVLLKTFGSIIVVMPNTSIERIETTSEVYVGSFFLIMSTGPTLKLIPFYDN